MTAGIGLCVGTANKCIRDCPGWRLSWLWHTDMQRMQDFPHARCISIYPCCTATSSARATPLRRRFNSCMRRRSPPGTLGGRVAQRIGRYRTAAHCCETASNPWRLKCLRPPTCAPKPSRFRLSSAGFTYEALHDALKVRGFVIYAGQGDLAAGGLSGGQHGASHPFGQFQGLLAALTGGVDDVAERLAWHAGRG